MTDDSDNVYTNDLDIANEFNSYFSSIFSIPTSSNLNDADFQTNPSHSIIQYIRFTPKQTHKVIKSLPNTASEDPEGISYIMMKEGGYFLALKLSDFFNLSDSRKNPLTMEECCSNANLQEW